MANSVKRFCELFTLLCLIAGFSGCAEVGLTVPTAVGGGAAGVDYSLTNNAYKTFSYPLAEVAIALRKALKKMDIRETGSANGKEKISISAATNDLVIDISLEKVTPTVTKIEVSAKRGVILKDKSTATEIIVQTEKNLEAKR